MPESLLSFSNIDLYGQTVLELEISDPTAFKNVAAATTDHVANLKGLDIDGVKVKVGDLILVWQQHEANLTENGIYFVSDTTNYDWVKFPKKITEESFIRAKKGENYKNRRWLYKRKKTQKAAKTDIAVSVTLSTPGTPTEIIQIYADQDILSEGRKLDPSWPNEIIAAHISDLVNSHKGTKYSATQNRNIVTIQAPAAQAENANTRPLIIQSENLTISPPNPTFDDGSTTEWSEFDLEKRNEIRKRRKGDNKQLQNQIKDDAVFARIYGFSYEGTYYDLPRPVLFLVHGEGDLVNFDEPETIGAPYPARAPGATSLTGLAAADFDFADGLRVWSYDKADYTIRMDVETGMFEQVLLDAMLDGPGGFDARGANVRGANARGANARGANARGANARGANARGGGNSD